MKLLLRLSKEAVRYRLLYVIAIFSTLMLTVINLAAPKALSEMTGIVSNGVDENGMKRIWILTAVLIGLYLGRILFRFLSNYLAHKAAWYLVGDLRTRTYDKLERMHIGYFHDKQTGDLMSRIVNDTRDFELLYAHMIPETITNIVTFIGVLIMLLTINVKLALITCAPIPLIFISGIIFSKKVRPFFRASQKKMGELNGKLQDNLSGLQEIQSFGREEYETQQVDEKNFEHVKAMLKALKISAIFHPCVEFISSIGTILVVAFGGYLAWKESLRVEDVVAFLLYLGLFYAPITGLANLLENMQQSMAGAERVITILDAPCEIKDKEGALALKDVKGEIRFENVSFSYETGGKILDDISFECEPGKMLALVGPTGVGKTTMTKLISRFYEPTNGHIYIDGNDINDITIESLRQNISPVLQDTFLFNGTIAENIGYAVPDADMDEIIEAAKAANIHKDIMNMPDGYDTLVGERGLRLSGGQKQRVAISRAILRKSPIIVLDEATASVDVETEKQIQEAINNITGKRTIVAIAHRLSTIRNADLILVIENCHIAERGTHEELVALGGIYSRMNKIQG
ncbi:ATP-binding cassette, subfamily B [Butyrivibrio fibrisolvens DSM 3071]|uniref:ATP-binding cassette, subfamily B n=1 Tax=Butyrivibrio fibrisolvens DSM 3071 TaxID=1121131 RepID=A0A1M5ZUK7_BUTFI|nr:ABC transporter ATP-binding protein [Butyrivibrio fibrisolvens]SHI27944.1 ATP-binding cassette, subfamily B [Butyrivibrio fibrisolvens DSM 3071]